MRHCFVMILTRNALIYSAIGRIALSLHFSVYICVAQPHCLYFVLLWSLSGISDAS